MSKRWPLDPAEVSVQFLGDRLVGNRPVGNRHYGFNVFEEHGERLPLSVVGHLGLEGCAEWIETAQKLGRAIPEPRGRLMFA